MRNDDRVLINPGSHFVCPHGFERSEIPGVCHLDRPGRDFTAHEDALALALDAAGHGEVRVVDPETGGEKGSKLARYDLLPWDVMTEFAEHFGIGARKYADRNWEKGYDWGLSLAALCRHLSAWATGEDIDPESGDSHLIAVMWHAAALRYFQLHGKGTDSRSRL